MISLALASMLLTAQASAAPARRIYSDCLNQAMRSHLDSKTDPPAFDSALVTTCAAQAAAYRNAILTAEAAAGSSRADAEELAEVEIEDLEANTKDMYRANLEAGTVPE